MSAGEKLIQSLYGRMRSTQRLFFRLPPPYRILSRRKRNTTIRTAGCYLLCMSVWLPAARLALGSDSRLADAVQQQDRQAAHSLLRERVNVNLAQPDGATALAWAAHWDDLETAELLIQSGANVNAANDYGVTPLSLACTNGSAAMVDRLLKAGADANAALPTGETPLMTAANSGNVDLVAMLLARTKDVNAKEVAGGQTALMWAVAEMHPEVVRLLVARGADVHARSKGGWTPLLFAAQKGDVESARMLIAAGADVNERSSPASGKLRSATGSMTPLLVAAASGQEEIGIFLLNQGADPNASDGTATALHYAVRKGINYIRRDTVGDYDPRPNLAELAKALLAHGADPNARIKKLPGGSLGSALINMVGATPLWLAAASFDDSLVRFLLAHGADPMLPTERGVTPLMVAAGVGRKDDRPADEERRALENVKLLSELGNDVNEVATAEDGLTALHGAARIGASAVIEFLVGKGARMEMMDKFGQTPLSVALGVTTKYVLDFQKVPTGPHPGTADLLLRLGALPLDASGVEILDVLHSGKAGPAPAAPGAESDLVDPDHQTSLKHR